MKLALPRQPGQPGKEGQRPATCQPGSVGIGSLTARTPGIEAGTPHIAGTGVCGYFWINTSAEGAPLHPAGVNERNLRLFLPEFLGEDASTASSIRNGGRVELSTAAEESTRVRLFTEPGSRISLPSEVSIPSGEHRALFDYDHGEGRRRVKVAVLRGRT